MTIFSSGLRNWIDANKKIKNEASCRRVPLHPELIDLGFLTYRDAIVAAGFEDKHLFPYLPVNRYGNRSDSTSKHFGRFLRGCGIADPRKVFHSFRHTVGTELHRAGVPISVAHRLLGHALSDGEHATYVHGDIPLKELYENGIAKLPYPDLDLNGLRCDQERIEGWIQRLKTKSARET